MKKIFTLFLLALTGGLSAQNFSVYQTNNLQTSTSVTLTNGYSLNQNTAVSSNTTTPTLSQFKVLIINNSATTLTLNVVRRIVYQNPTLLLNGAGSCPDTYFCFGFNCFPSTVSSPAPADYCILGPSGTTVSPYDNSRDNGTPFVIDLAEGLTLGKYFINYKVYDVNNPSDSVSFLVKYNASLMLPSSLQAWTLDASGTNTVTALPNGAVTSFSTGAAATTEVRVKFQNTDPSNTYTYSIIRKDVLLHHVTPSDSAKAHFCFGDLGSCYNQFLFEPTSDFVTLGPGVSTTGANHIITDLDEATAVGGSIVNYKIFNKATGKTGPGADTLSFTFKYNLLSGINENKTLVENISNVYPNPSTNNANITIVLTDEVLVKVQVFNSLGALVYTGQEQQLTGKNKLAIDCTNFNNGLYFITVTAGNAKITKRLVVNK